MNSALPGHGPQQSTWQRIKLVLQVVEIRLRFIAILAAIGLVIGYWDTLQNYWDKWTRGKQTTIVKVEADTEFYCPMHPWVVRAGLEQNQTIPKCPICGMTLSLRKKGLKVELPENVTGRVQLSPDRIRLAGVSTVPVTDQPMVKEISTVGSVTYDEKGLSRIVARVSGYVEKILVAQTFDTVEPGQPLCEIYSPQFLSAAQELLLATRNASLGQLVTLAKTKLELLGMARSEVDAIVHSGKVNARVIIRSPQHGHVIRKDIVTGAHVEAGQTLYEIADLSQVWIEAEVYENDVQFVKDGQAVEITVEAIPGRTFHGKVGLVHPHLNVTARTNTVRVTLENTAHQLRPGMYASVHLRIPVRELEPYRTMGPFLAVPESAVIDTGVLKTVYIEREQGLYDGIRVELGPRVGGFYPVLRGLKRGDRVVARGAFLVDAETRLNPAANAGYSGGTEGRALND